MNDDDVIKFQIPPAGTNYYELKQTVGSSMEVVWWKIDESKKNYSREYYDPNSNEWVKAGFIRARTAILQPVSNLIP